MSGWSIAFGIAASVIGFVGYAACAVGGMADDQTDEAILGHCDIDQRYLANARRKLDLVS